MKFAHKIKVISFTILLLTMGRSLVFADDIRGMQIPNEVASLRELLAVVDKAYQGKILEVEMEQEDVDGNKIWIYEIKLLNNKGRVYELEYNAITLELLKVEH